jgi:hypothetical protein
MAQAALAQERLPRQLSFAAALAVVVGNWLPASFARQDLLRALAQAQWRLIAGQRLGIARPCRAAPPIKRRPKPHKLLTKPRPQAQADLLHSSGVKLLDQEAPPPALRREKEARSSEMNARVPSSGGRPSAGNTLVMRADLRE